MNRVFIVKAMGSGDPEVQYVVRGFADQGQAEQFSSACQAINDELMEILEAEPTIKGLVHTLDPEWEQSEFMDYSVVEVPFGAFSIGTSQE